MAKPQMPIDQQDPFRGDGTAGCATATPDAARWWGIHAV
jgi:hypothetical protein